MTDITQRNRQLKKTLEAAFGRGNVRVRGSRGTGYGWADVNINYAPLDFEERRELEAKCFQLLRAAKIGLGRSYTDDDCQNTCSQILISFEQCRFHRTHRHADGALWGCQFDADEWRLIEPAIESAA